MISWLFISTLPTTNSQNARPPHAVSQIGRLSLAISRTGRQPLAISRAAQSRHFSGIAQSILKKVGHFPKRTISDFSRNIYMLVIVWYRRHFCTMIFSRVSKCWCYFLQDFTLVLNVWCPLIFCLDIKFYKSYTFDEYKNILNFKKSLEQKSDKFCILCA